MGRLSGRQRAFQFCSLNLDGGKVRAVMKISIIDYMQQRTKQSPPLVWRFELTTDDWGAFWIADGGIPNKKLSVWVSQSGSCNNLLLDWTINGSRRAGNELLQLRWKSIRNLLSSRSAIFRQLERFSLATLPARSFKNAAPFFSLVTQCANQPGLRIPYTIPAIGY